MTKLVTFTLAILSVSTKFLNNQVKKGKELSKSKVKLKHKIP